jgi:glutamate/tyrosine decarboxylase-like PLP-dependent enzyme
MSSNPYLQTTADGAGRTIATGDSARATIRALKLWFLIREQGAEGLQRRLRRDLENAQWFASEVGRKRLARSTRWSCNSVRAPRAGGLKAIRSTSHATGEQHQPFRPRVSTSAILTDVDGPRFDWRRGDGTQAPLRSCGRLCERRPNVVLECPDRQKARPDLLRSEPRIANEEDSNLAK